MKAYINTNNIVIAIGENDSSFPNCTIVEITEQKKIFIESCEKPMHINDEFIEGITQEEIKVEKTLFYTIKLQNLVTDLRIKAKGLAIGKQGSNAYIIAQVDFYQRKYQNAIDLNPIAEIDADLEAEGLRDFNIPLSEFKELIVYMYLLGEEKERLLNSFIEQCRTFITTQIELSEWQKFDDAFALAENLHGITTVDQARSIKNQIMSL